MNSPPELASPSPSTPSSGSPPPEETNYTEHSKSATSHLLNLASQISSSLTGGPSKRRLPGGSAFAAASSSRDTKSRRREDTRRMGGGSSNWEGGKESGKREKEDLVDAHVVDYLRGQIGDPFQEGIIKNST